MPLRVFLPIPGARKEVPAPAFVHHQVDSVRYLEIRNKATFHNCGEDSRAIAKFIIADVKRRIQVDFHRFSQVKFNSIWVHPAVCKVCADKLVFFF